MYVVISLVIVASLLVSIWRIVIVMRARISQVLSQSNSYQNISDEKIVKNSHMWTIVVFGSLFVFAIYARDYLDSQLLDKYSLMMQARDLVIEINSEPVKNLNGYRSELSNVKTSRLAGSHPTVEIPVKIHTKKMHIDLILRRDSRDKRLYWIQKPEFLFNRFLGYIESDRLDNY